MSSATHPDSSLVNGTASKAVKEHIMGCMQAFMRPNIGFANDVAKRLLLTEVSIRPNATEPTKNEGVVVYEIETFDGMLNSMDQVHGGCLAFLLDICSSMPIIALSLANGGSGSGGVTQAMNMIYHSPTPSGECLRIISTTLTMGARAMSARCEIWNISKNRLVLSGTHVKMEPSAPRSKL